MLRTCGWTRTLTPEQLARVEEECVEKIVPAGAYFVRRGEVAEYWYGIVEGLVKLFSVTRDGKTMSFAALTEGAWFGEGSMLWGPHHMRMYDGTALRDSRLLCVPYRTFEWLSAISIEFNRYVARHLAGRLGQAMGMLEHDRLMPPEMRLANCLHDIVNPNVNPGTGTRISITQEEIGYLCGLSRQVVNRILREFEDVGLIKLEYGVLSVLSIARLRAAAYGEWQHHELAATSAGAAIPATHASTASSAGEGSGRPAAPT